MLLYLADSHAAIVTSGNLTTGGLLKNFEYGVYIRDSHVVRTIHDDLAEYSALGAQIHDAQLDKYCDIAREVRSTFEQAQRDISRSVRNHFAAVIQEAEAVVSG